MNGLKSLLVFAVFSLLFSTRAFAQSYKKSRSAMYPSMSFHRYTVSFSTIVATGPSSLVTLIGNSVVLGKNTPSKGWGIAGVVSSCLGIVGHAVGMAMSNGSAVVIEAPFLAMHVTTFGVSVANLVKATRRPGMQQRLKPMDSEDYLEPPPKMSGRTLFSVSD